MGGWRGVRAESDEYSPKRLIGTDHDIEIWRDHVFENSIRTADTASLTKRLKSRIDYVTFLSRQSAIATKADTMPKGNGFRLATQSPRHTDHSIRPGNS
jgi:hypothetical protein